jgi:NTE family protein
MFAALFTTMMEAHDQRHMDEETAVRAIKIRTEKVRTTDFDLKPADSDALYERGRQGAKEFFECWDAIGGFAGYVAKYRQPGS